MRAVVIAIGHGSGSAPLGERYPVPLLPLVDRPFIQHVVEVLVEGGATEFDLVLHHQPEQLEALLGDGTRWGSAFRFHLARDPFRPYAVFKGLEGLDEPVLLAHADRLPQAQLAQAKPPPQAAAPVLFCWRDSSAGRFGDSVEWTGWAWVPARLLASLPERLDERGLEAHLFSLAHGKGSLVEVPRPLSAQSPEELLAAHRWVLADRFPGLMLTGREKEKGIRLSRNTRIHPTAQLLPPVYIGENCRIGAGVRLGPNASIGNDCVLDAHCAVENTVIFPGSFAGEGVELADAIVDHNRLVNTRVGGAVVIADEFILGSISIDPFRRWLASLLSRTAALALLAFTWPVLLAAILYLKGRRGGRVLCEKEVLRLPLPLSPARQQKFSLWSLCPEGAAEKGGRDFLLRFLPGLIPVARGQLHFVGVEPRTRFEIEALPRDWQALCRRAKAGLVTEARLCWGDSPSPDELYAAEAFYAVKAGMWHDLKLLLRYFGRLLKGQRD